MPFRLSLCGSQARAADTKLAHAVFLLARRCALYAVAARRLGEARRGNNEIDGYTLFATALRLARADTHAHTHTHSSVLALYV